MLEKCDIQSLAGLQLCRMLEEELHVAVQVKNDMDYMAYGAYHTRSDNRGTWQRFIFPVTVRGSLAADLSLTEKY